MLQQAIERIQTAGNNHPQVTTSTIGVLDKLALTNYDYPLMNTHIGDNNTLSFPSANFQIVLSVLDLLEKDLSNEIKVTNDMLQIAMEIVHSLAYNYDNDFIIVQEDEIEVTQVLSKTEDYLGGVQLFIPIQLDYKDVTSCDKISYGAV